MCGRFNIIDSPDVLTLLKELGVELYKPRPAPDLAPGATVQTIHEVNGNRVMSDAIWWLILDSKTLKPNYKYASFNSKSSRLNEKKSISYKPYRESRCIIPASAFVEGLGDKKTYHKIELENSAIAFGGLLKEWLNNATGELVYSCSIITLGPLLPEWLHIHPKSFPLMLPYEDTEIIDKWLDKDFQDIEQFEELLEPKVTRRQIVTKIDKPSNWKPVANSFYIVSDEVIASQSFSPFRNETITENKKSNIVEFRKAKDRF